MNNIKKSLGSLALLISLGTPLFAMAADASLGGTPPASTCTPGTICNPIQYSNFSDFVAKITTTAANVLMPFVVLAFVYSGFLFIKAQGNQKGLEEAKTAIWYSIIGAFILFGAWGFAHIIGTTVSTITNP